MYAYPTSLDDEVLKTIAEEEKICKYLDIPLQHSHPEVLKKMGRPFGEKDTVGLIDRIRNIIPDVVLRTAFITGHPGETPARFEHLMDFVEKMKFYHMGVFAYSAEEGSKSAEFRTRASYAEAERRREKLMQLQQGISLELRKQRVGSSIPAVCENIIGNGKRLPDLIQAAMEAAESDPENPVNIEEEGFLIDISGDETIISSRIPNGTTAIGRTVYDAPEIDSVLFIKGNPPAAGEFFTAKITGSDVYDLTTEME
jgi:tRNA A37 methylthiotransferase MiaB